MVNYCVPFCKSHANKKEIRISFHEFPVDLELRKVWLKNISREIFKVNDNSHSSVVCSKHFKNDDFVSGSKIKRLKKGVRTIIIWELFMP